MLDRLICTRRAIYLLAMFIAVNSMNRVPALAELITFDTLATNGGSGKLIPLGYANLYWSGFYAIDSALVASPNGFVPGTVSSPNVAFNVSGGQPSIDAEPGGGTFNLDSLYITAAWDDDLSVTVQGYNGFNLVTETVLPTSATVSTPYTLVDFDNLTQVNFLPSGGTPHPGYAGSGQEFALDNVVVDINPPAVPEPASLSLLVLAASCILSRPGRAPSAFRIQKMPSL
jgi:hypothetical protein